MRFLPAPLPKPQPIEPLHMMRRFERAHETGELAIPSELSDFAALYQEWTGARFQSITYTKLPRAKECTPTETVLVPFTGGVASTAALWTALQEGKSVWLFYLEGFSVGEEAEKQSIRASAVGARDANGCPLLVMSDERLQCRITTLPNAYPLRPDQLAPMHPLAMMALYVQVMNAAQACQCSTVLWSGFWEQRPMMRSLVRYFTAAYPHQALFAHEDRHSAMAALLQANEQSALTQDGPLTAGPTLGQELLHRCYSCQRTLAEVKASQARVPSPMSAQCGECAQCTPWIELCIEAEVPAYRQVHCFGSKAEAKPKKRPARSKGAPREPKKRSGETGPRKRAHKPKAAEPSTEAKGAAEPAKPKDTSSPATAAAEANEAHSPTRAPAKAKAHAKAKGAGEAQQPKSKPLPPVNSSSVQALLEIPKEPLPVFEKPANKNPAPAPKRPAKRQKIEAPNELERLAG